jgi:hypothetical protein
VPAGGSNLRRMAAVLTRRDLNRATLARQQLLARGPRDALGTVTHLTGLQGQAPNPPYTGLWSRVEGFAGEDLSRLIEARDVVRMTLMRGTVHVTATADARWLRPLTEVQFRATVATAYAAHLAGVDLGELAARVRELVEETPRTPAELAADLAGRWPGRASQAFTNAASAWVPLVQVPPRGLWRRGGLPRLTTFERWTGTSPAGEADPARLVRRYLAAFGPATVKDVQKWAGVTGLAPVVKALRPELAGFTDEQGTELVDLPDAPRPGADVAAPVRFLPEFDNVLLAYARYDRVMDPAHKAVLFTRNGRILGTVLVDGFVAAHWRTDTAKRTTTLTVSPLVPLDARARRAVTAEGERLLGLLAEDGAGREIVVQ